ncbi:efflux RND transporter permease subunit [Mucilaginibacter mali]|uniref:Efflux RND transporter permease subunit n=1 Tax=Mucilaginibacter mali TaxID=2740462 RepID=A0A7D4TW59_9SPHI|nr:efflux RND transporter permease subunit [Mucilaginibacter mali]QKJ29177.1 efflux RND transporter permease subunit [Mucilaginibacter mali]
MKDLEKEFGPSSWAIDNKTAIYVVIFLITLLGIISYNNLPKENFPDITIPKIYVSAPYPGTSPANMETLVTRQIEKQLKSLKGLKKVTSNSYQDYCAIVAEFNPTVKIEDAKQRVKDAVDKAKPDLPQNDPNFKDPQVNDINFSDLPILYVNISGNYDLKKLKEYADELKDDIEGMREISKVDEVGALTPQIQINVDMNKMAAAQLGFGDIIQAVGNENVTSSAGTVRMDGVRRSINLRMAFKSADEVNNMVIRNPKGQAIYLRDIAEVKDGFKEQESYARLYGKNVITLNVTKRSGENLIEASDKIQALIAQKEKTSFPKGLEIKVTGDQSEKTRTTLHDLINTIIIGFILVTVILMFFMGTTNAIFVALSVPLSCFVAFLVMPAIGFTLNMIVLFAFLLALGIVVDDAIVVIENTHRIFANGAVPIKKAAKIAAGEVFLPVLSGTLTTLAPFVPLAFWNSIIGKFMFFLPITLIITLLASLLVAYIFNPVFAVDFMGHKESAEEEKPRFDRKVKRTLIGFAIVAVLGYLMNVGVGNFVVFIAFLYLLDHFVLEHIIHSFQHKIWPKFQDFYAGLLRRALHSPWWVLAGTFVLFFLSFVIMAIRQPQVEFFPNGDPNFVYVYVELPVGTDQAHTNEVTKQVEEKVTKVVGRDNPIVSSIISNVTVGVTDPQDEDQGNYANRGKVTVAFVEFGERHGEDTKKYLDKIRNSVQGIPGAKITVNKEQGGPPTQKAISIELAADNLDTLVRTTDRLRSYINKQNIAGIEDLRSDLQSNKPEIVFDIDRERANREGVSTNTISRELFPAIFGYDVSDFRETTEDDYKINVRGIESQRYNVDQLRNLKITYRDMGTGGAIRQVPISAFSDIRYVSSYGNIKHKQQKRVINLTSNVLQGYNTNEVNAAIQQAINRYKLPSGVTVKMGGEQEDQAEAMGFLLSALAVSFGLILIILMLQFNSVGKTLIILSEIFFSIIGVLLGIAIFGMKFSIVMTMIGIIALAGVVVRNGILLVEFSDLLTSQNENTFEAIIEAGRTRMTPVLLTATAAILGLIPLAVGLNIDFVSLFTTFNPHIYFGGDNVAFWGPLAWTMIFGLAFATLITLILVPCMYLIRIRLKTHWFGKKNKAEMARLEDPQLSHA